MKTLIKLIILPFGLALVIVGAIAVIFIVRSEKALKPGLEKTLSFIYATDARIGSVEVDYFGETMKLHDLTLANPAGFDAGNTFTCGEVTVLYNTRNLLSRRPALRKLRFTGVVIDLRYELGKGTNMGKLMESAARLGLVNDPEAPEDAANTYTIDAIEVDAAKLNLSAGLIPGGGVGVDLDPVSIAQVADGRPVDLSELGLIINERLFGEGVNLKGLLKPAGDALKEELAKILERGKAAVAPAPTPRPAQ